MGDRFGISSAVGFFVCFLVKALQTQVKSTIDGRRWSTLDYLHRKWLDCSEPTTHFKALQTEPSLLKFSTKSSLTDSSSQALLLQRPITTLTAISFEIFDKIKSHRLFISSAPTPKAHHYTHSHLFWNFRQNQVSPTLHLKRSYSKGLSPH